MLKINQTFEKESAVYTLAGRLDTVTAPELERALAEIPGSVTKLTLDLEKLEYISSAGLRVLLSVQKTMSRRGTMRLTHVGENVMEILEVTGFTDILTIE